MLGTSTCLYRLIVHTVAGKVLFACYFFYIWYASDLSDLSYIVCVFISLALLNHHEDVYKLL